MLEGGRYLYVGFMCHQSIEKMLKAYFVFRKNEIPPFTHNLTKLAELSGLNEIIKENHKDFLFSLQPLNIEARYPSYKKQVLESLNRNNTSDILAKTKEFQIWVKQMLPIL
ncbi:MAG: HEPN domain-containing protein [Ignavibacteria bacterium]|nr:HEPN domain-containing protein [Ignavibacteria bacterium]